MWLNCLWWFYCDVNENLRHKLSWDMWKRALLYRQTVKALGSLSICTVSQSISESCHEIMVIFVLCKLILKTCMHSHPVRLDVWFLVRPFVYFHTLCVRTAKALARLREYAGSPEPSLVAYVIRTIISWAGSFAFIHISREKESDKELYLLSCSYRVTEQSLIVHG